MRTVTWSLLVLLLAGAACAQEEPQPQPPADPAAPTFKKLLGYLNAGSASGIAGMIEPGSKGKFKLSGQAGGMLTSKQATTQLQAWFNAGKKGGWKLRSGKGLTRTFERKTSTGKQRLTVTLKTVQGRYHLYSLSEL